MLTPFKMSLHRKNVVLKLEIEDNTNAVGNKLIADLKPEYYINEEAFRLAIGNIKVEDACENLNEANSDRLKFNDNNVDGVVIKEEIEAKLEIDLQESIPDLIEIKTKIERVKEVSETTKDIVRAKKSIIQKKLECNICKKLFLCQSKLKAHTNIHTGERPYKCDFCKKAFNHISNLKKHKLLHGVINKYSCNICCESFLRVQDLRSHKLIDHNVEKPYVCDVCSKAFSWVGYLKRHKLIHMGVKPHKCDICGHSFRLPEHLRAHKIIHDEKPYSCTICDNRYFRKTQLLIHERKHTGERPYVCDVCNKSFRCPKYLKRHQSVHKKAFSCDICRTTFSRAKDLNTHQLTHAVEEPIFCDVFSEPYKSSSQNEEMSICGNIEEDEIEEANFDEPFKDPLELDDNNAEGVDIKIKQEPKTELEFV